MRVVTFLPPFDTKTNPGIRLFRHKIDWYVRVEIKFLYRRKQLIHLLVNRFSGNVLVII